MAAGDRAISSDPARWHPLIGVATSIDALAAGVTLATIEVSVVLAAVVIGGVTFVLATGCAHFGRHLGTKAGRGADACGGLLLICMGSWILISHLRA